MNCKGYRTKNPLYSVWLHMIGRCYKVADPAYPAYGGRGIYVCERWLKSFESFVADMGPRPSHQHSIDRRDNNGPYSPENCRWATTKEQTRNTRHNRRFAAGGVTLTMVEWCDKTGIPQSTLWNRLRLGWTPEQALEMDPAPPKRTARGMPVGWLKLLAGTGLTRECVINRVRILGWPFEKAISTPAGKYRDLR